jgi:hypothetical protein
MTRVYLTVQRFSADVYVGKIYIHLLKLKTTFLIVHVTA